MRPIAQTIIGVPRGFKLTPEEQAEVQEALVTSLPISVFQTIGSGKENIL
jgi:hypothetical protein